MRYKNQSKSASEVGRELKSGALLEGSVRKAGNRFEWLERAFKERSPFLPMMIPQFYFDNVRSDPRMDAMIGRLGLS